MVGACEACSLRILFIQLIVEALGYLDAVRIRFDFERRVFPVKFEWRLGSFISLFLPPQVDVLDSLGGQRNPGAAIKASLLIVDFDAEFVHFAFRAEDFVRLRVILAADAMHNLIVIVDEMMVRLLDPDDVVGAGDLRFAGAFGANDDELIRMIFRLFLLFSLVFHRIVDFLLMVFDVFLPFSTLNLAMNLQRRVHGFGELANANISLVLLGIFDDQQITFGTLLPGPTDGLSGADLVADEIVPGNCDYIQLTGACYSLKSQPQAESKVEGEYPTYPI